MTTPPRFVHVVDDVPELEGVRPVLVHALDGFLDAGHAGSLAAGSLLGEQPGRVVASFDIDEFYDYRARRPPMTFAENHYEGYEAPRLVVRLQHDDADVPYLLLHGPEPDTHWEAFCRAVLHLVERFDVRMTVALGSVPMAVPHTRPVKLTNHATRPDLLVQENVWTGDIRVPSSAQALLEIRLGEADQDACGFVAHIPHYVAQFDYPRAAATLLEQVSVVTDLVWDLEGLRVLGEEKMVEISAQIEESADVREVVRGLEQQYDAFHRAAADEAPSLLAEPRDLPSGDELGAEFERFLAGLDGPDRED
ncbi:MAG: PAC2 family protein [Nocardioides sp.]|nr:PAC2 family protein [Nocardioides sp.]